MVTYARLTSRKMAARANRLNEQIYGPMERTVNLSPRPYMGPALDAESPKFEDLWANSVKG
jgi:hypothetical protein